MDGLERVQNGGVVDTIDLGSRIMEEMHPITLIQGHLDADVCAVVCDGR